MEKPSIQEFKSSTPPNWRKLCEELVEASGNADRMDGLASWEYLLDRTRTLLAQSDPDPYKEEIDCETCEGLGTIDERLGGYGDSNSAATCPDCDGTGVIVVSAPSPEKGLSDNDLIAAANEAGLCYPQCWDFSSQPERLEHLRSFAHSIIARCGNHFPDAKKMVRSAPAPKEPQGDWFFEFEQWLAREMPAGTVIGDPLWWAPRIARAATSRFLDSYGESKPAPAPAEGEVAILARWMRDCAGSAQRNGYHDAENMHIRIAELLENQFASSPAQIKGYVANAVADLHAIADVLSAKERHLQARKLTRAADLLECLILKPIPLSERLPEATDCDEKGRCWVGYGEAVDEYDSKDQELNPSWELCKVHPQDEFWLPAHSLPVPSQL